MPPFDGALDARNQRDAASASVLPVRTQIELMIVQRDRQRVIAELGRAVDKLTGGIRNPVGRVVCGVGMEIDFQHPLSGIHKACLSSRPAISCVLQRKSPVNYILAGRNSGARLDSGELRV